MSDPSGDTYGQTSRLKLKVLGFDGWTVGVKHYSRLREAAENLGVQIELVHLGSWGDEPGRPLQEHIEGLTVRDIAYYNTIFLDRILEFEKPDLVLFLSTETFAHRAFQRFCKARGIPTVYLYHAFLSVFVFHGTSGQFKATLRGQIRFVFQQAYKSLRYSFPAYAVSLWETSAPASEWRRFISDFICRLRGKVIVRPAADARPTRCCVYVKADLQDAIQRFGMLDSEVDVVGNPDLIQFGVTSDVLDSTPAFWNVDGAEVMYIDTGFASFGAYFGSIAAYGNFLIALNADLADQGRRLVFKIKPHPDHYREELSEFLKYSGIELVGGKDFLTKLRGCCACIVEPSTLALVPAILGMPVLMCRRGPYANLAYGRVFDEYPRGAYLGDDMEAFGQTLRDLSHQTDSSAMEVWRQEYAGPLPPEEMPYRVVRSLRELVLSYAKRPGPPPL